MSETCRVIINQVKQKLHLVGYLLTRYFKDVWYHEHKKKRKKIETGCFNGSVVGGSILLGLRTVSQDLYYSGIMI